MAELTPAERLDLKADEARIKALQRPGREDAVGDILHEGRIIGGGLTRGNTEELQFALERYIVLVELVRRLHEEAP